MNSLWVVEIKFHGKSRWEPTVGVKLSRAEGRQELAEWKRDNQPDKFRLVRYQPSKSHKGSAS